MRVHLFIYSAVKFKSTSSKQNDNNAEKLVEGVVSGDEEQ